VTLFDRVAPSLSVIDLRTLGTGEDVVGEAAELLGLLP
jgi:hypothetical protein